MLTINDVTVRYSGAKKLSVQQVSLNISAGEIVGLTGDNGAGKSTLIRVINGSLRPSTGQVLINDVDIVDKPSHARRMTATMRQTNTPIRGMTPRQAVVNAGLIRGIPISQARAKARELFAALEMEEVADSPGEVLSGGMRRLTNLATTIAQEAPMVLLDEPTNDVDPARRHLLWKLVASLRDTGRTVLICTHNIDEAARYTSRQIIMSHGQLVHDGSIDDAFTASRWAFIDVPSDVTLPENLAALVTQRMSGSVTLAVPEGEAELNKLLEQLRSLSPSVTVRQNHSFESIFETHLEREA